MNYRWQWTCACGHKSIAASNAAAQKDMERHWRNRNHTGPAKGTTRRMRHDEK